MKKGLAVLFSLLVVVMIGLLLARTLVPGERDGTDLEPTFTEMSEEPIATAETSDNVKDSVEQNEVNSETAIDEQYEAASALFSAGEYEGHRCIYGAGGL